MLIMIPLTAIRTQVLSSNKSRDFVQYSFPIESNVNIQNSNKFYLVHYNNWHDTKDYYALKKDGNIDF